MTNADKYRAHARHCVIKALMEGKLTWLRMAQTWLGMIPEAQRTAADAFQANALEIAALDSLGGDSEANNVTDERDVGFDLVQRGSPLICCRLRWLRWSLS
jgi:hypothetical protein